jgi:hypothetical protein
MGQRKYSSSIPLKLPGKFYASEKTINFAVNTEWALRVAVEIEKLERDPSLTGAIMFFMNRASSRRALNNPQITVSRAYKTGTAPAKRRAINRTRHGDSWLVGSGSPTIEAD